MGKKIGNVTEVTYWEKKQKNIITGGNGPGPRWLGTLEKILQAETMTSGKKAPRDMNSEPL